MLQAGRDTTQCREDSKEREITFDLCFTAWILAVFLFVSLVR